MATPLRILSSALALFLFLPGSFAQTYTPKYVSMGAYTRGYYEYLPQGYDSSASQTYPLILFIHGAGDVGDGSPEQLPRLLKVGLTKEINTGGFPDSFTVNGQTFQFIIISPQFTQLPGTSDAIDDLDTILEYILKHYKVDLTRIYLTGLSKGGGYIFDFAGKNPGNANRLAAIVTSAEASLPVYAQARVIAATNLPVWATHNLGDQSVSVSYTTTYIDWINEAPAPTPLAKKTIFPGSGHNAWTQTYYPGFRENGLNIYEWMLQYRRKPVAAAPPVVIESFEMRPNPAKDKIEIRLEGPVQGPVTASVFSSSGMLVKQWGFDKQDASLQKTLYMNGLAAGSYLLQIKMGDFRQSKLFLKN